MMQAEKKQIIKPKGEPYYAGYSSTVSAAYKDQRPWLTSLVGNSVADVLPRDSSWWEEASITSSTKHQKRPSYLGTLKKYLFVKMMNKKLRIK